jgi:threonine/homoserine/homoserine lactone efflux protein
MPSSDILIPFLIASAIFACIPGPGMFYAAAQTLASGRRAGWYSALGFHLAAFGHIAAAAFGVSLLLEVMPTLFMVMKALGAGYLIWLGVRHLLARPPRVRSGPLPRVPEVGKALKDGMIVELLNPKSALFYLAFLPQFADTTASLPVWMQIVVLGLIVNAMFTITDAILIELSHAARLRLQASARGALLFRRIGGGILVALGVNLAFTRS